MKIALVFNDAPIVAEDVINFRGTHTSEYYSKSTIIRVAEALTKNGHDVKIINGNKNVINEIQNFMLKNETLGMVFNMAYGIQGISRYSHIPSILEMVGIPYVGSSPETHSICQNKVITKIMLENYEILTPKYWHVKYKEKKYSEIKFPVILKPVSESTSHGIHIAKDHEELSHFLYELTNDFQQDALVEQFISGREFTVSIIGNYPEIEILPIVEFNFDGDFMSIQTSKTKSKHLIPKICPAQIPVEIEHKIKSICVKIVEKLNIQDYCRIDFRLDSLGNPDVLEVNSMASLSPTGSLVKSAKIAGYNYENIINRIFDISVLRCLGMKASNGITQITDEIN